MAFTVSAGEYSSSSFSQTGLSGGSEAARQTAVGGLFQSRVQSTQTVQRKRAPEKPASTEKSASSASLSFNKLKFVIDRDSNDVMVNVLDGESGKVLRVLPPEELRRLGDGLDEGAFLDESA